MRILDRYLRSTIFQNTLLVTLMLTALFSFLEILEQLDDLDQGTYTIGTAAYYVLLTLPRRIVDLMPIIAMLGTAFALNTLARSSELIAMRAAGLSIARIGLGIFKAGVVLMIIVVVLDEFVAPPLQQQAIRIRNAAVTGETQLTFQGAGFWAKQNGTFAHLRSMEHGRIPADLDIFEFDEQGNLSRYLHARTAESTEDNQWLLKYVNVKVLSGPRIEYDYFESLAYPRILLTRDLEKLEVPAANLATSNLYEYVSDLNKQGDDAYEYELSLWRKLARPLVTGAMVLVAIPFGFGSGRTTSGRRITIASLAGLFLYLGNELSGNAGMLFHTDPVILTLTPVALILLTAFVLMKRAG